MARPIRVLKDYATPTLKGKMSSILRLAVTTYNFEIKPTLITMIYTSIQFRRHPNDDPHAHINNFLKIYDTLKINKVRDTVI